MATFISTGTTVAFVGSAENHDVYFNSPSATGNRFYDFENEGTLNFSTSAYAGGSVILRGSVTIIGGLTVGIAGNLTLANGLILTNSGTLNYAGTLTNNGATIIGNSPIDTSP